MGRKFILLAVAVASISLCVSGLQLFAAIQRSQLARHRQPALQPIPDELCDVAQLLKDDLGGQYAICIRSVPYWPHDKLRIGVMRPNPDAQGGWTSEGFVFYHPDK